MSRLEDSINKITGLMDTSKFSRVAIQTNVFTDYPDSKTIRKGKFTAYYYADSSKELKIVVSITEYDTSTERFFTRYYFNDKSIIKMQVSRGFSAVLNEYYYVQGMLSAKNENFLLAPRNYNISLFVLGLDCRDYYYNTKRK